MTVIHREDVKGLPVVRPTADSENWMQEERKRAEKERKNKKGKK